MVCYLDWFFGLDIMSFRNHSHLYAIVFEFRTASHFYPLAGSQHIDSKEQPGENGRLAILRKYGTTFLRQVRSVEEYGLPPGKRLKL